MLMPRKVKHRKQQRGRRPGSQRWHHVNFGDFGIQALEPGWLTARQIEAARIAMTRHVKRGGKVWIRVFPDKPVTQKPAETRMGSGKGNPEHWVAVVRPGRSCSSWPASTRPRPRGHGAGYPEAARSRRASSCGPVPTARPRWRSDGDRCRLVVLDDDELEQPPRRVRRELLNLRFQLATGQLDNPRASATSQRDVARVLTVLRDREIAVAEALVARDPEAQARPERTLATTTKSTRTQSWRDDHDRRPRRRCDTDATPTTRPTRVEDEAEDEADDEAEDAGDEESSDDEAEDPEEEG